MAGTEGVRQPQKVKARIIRRLRWPLRVGMIPGAARAGLPIGDEGVGARNPIPVIEIGAIPCRIIERRRNHGTL